MLDQQRCGHAPDDRGSSDGEELHFSVGRIKAVGNTASKGAKMALMSFREREMAFGLMSFVEYLELSAQEDFNERFIRNLRFPVLDMVAT